MVHRHPSRGIWIKRRMRQPAADGWCPLAQLQVGQLTAVKVLKGRQNITPFLRRVPKHYAEWAFRVQASAKLPPEGIRTSKGLPEGHHIAAMSSHQTETHLPLIRRCRQ